MEMDGIFNKTVFYDGTVKTIIAFACKAKSFVIASLPLFSTTFPE